MKSSHKKSEKPPKHVKDIPTKFQELIQTPPIVETLCATPEPETSIEVWSPIGTEQKPEPEHVQTFDTPEYIIGTREQELLDIETDLKLAESEVTDLTNRLKAKKHQFDLLVDLMRKKVSALQSAPDLNLFY